MTADEHSTDLPIVAPEPPPKKLFPVTGAQYCLGLRCLNLHTQRFHSLPHFTSFWSKQHPWTLPTLSLVDQKIKLLMFCSICMPLQLKQRQITFITGLNITKTWYKRSLKRQIQIQREHPFHAAGREVEVGWIPKPDPLRGATPAPKWFNYPDLIQMSSGCLNQGRTSCQNICSHTAHQHWQHLKNSFASRTRRKTQKLAWSDTKS